MIPSLDLNYFLWIIEEQKLQVIQKKVSWIYNRRIGLIIYFKSINKKLRLYRKDQIYISAVQIILYLPIHLLHSNLRENINASYVTVKSFVNCFCVSWTGINVGKLFWMHSDLSFSFGIPLWYSRFQQFCVLRLNTVNSTS